MIGSATAGPGLQRFLEAERALLAKYGMGATTRYLDLHSPRLRVRVLEAGEGRPVLLVHGLGAAADSWVPLMAELSGLRLIAVDRPGSGLSDPFDFGGADLPAHAVAWISSLLDALGLERAHLIGNSIGGTMALWFALARPERVDRVVLMGAPPVVMDSHPPFSMRLMSLPFIARRALSGPTPAKADATFRRMGHAGGILGPELTELVVAAQSLPGYSADFVSLLSRVTNLFGRRVSLQASDLRLMAAPTLVVWGDGDTHAPLRIGEELVRTLPHARLEVRTGGHLPWLDDPAGCGRLIQEFLSPASSGRAPAQ